MEKKLIVVTALDAVEFARLVNEKIAELKDQRVKHNLTVSATSESFAAFFLIEYEERRPYCLGVCSYRSNPRPAEFYCDYHNKLLKHGSRACDEFIFNDRAQEGRRWW